ncbi:MAG TPA: alpha/beta hydrolase [Herpetosiphonaceae bacterium]
MDAWRTGEVEVDGVRLRYARAGSGPPLVLAHGFSDDGGCWASIAEALAGEYELIMPDARGHGRSSAPERDYGAEAHARDLAGLIGALELGRPLLLGHSMGAISIMTLAALHPGLPRAIALEDPPPWWTLDEPILVDDGWREQGKAWIAGFQERSVDELVAARQAESPEWPAADFRPWVESKRRLHPNVFNNERSVAGGWRDSLRRISCPALLLAGDVELGAMVAAEHAAKLRELIPQLQLAHLPGASHDVRRRQFAPYVAAVRAFFAQVPPA